MSHDEQLEESLDRYTLRRVQVGAEAADHSEVSNIARAFYEDDRFSRAFQNEVTAEMRRWQLHDLFKRVDAEQKLSTKKKKQKEEIDVLGEVTNNTKVLETQKRSEIVTRTEIVPMLPCKGYELPRGHLFIGGRGDDVEVFYPMEEDQQIEALLDKAQLAEEQLLEEQHAKLILKERLEKEQMKRHTILRPQKAKKLRGSEKEAESELQEMEVKFPNCTVG